MITLGPTLETERLILRPPVPQDLEGLAAFCADPQATAFLGGPISRPEAWRTLAALAGSWVLNGFGMFCVVEKASGAWIGRAGPLRPEGWPGTEVGWGLLPRAWGKGYAYEAAAACMNFVVDELGWTEIIHCIDPSNVASENLARRLGSAYLRLGTLPPPNSNPQVQIWGQTREEWRVRRG